MKQLFLFLFLLAAPTVLLAQRPSGATSAAAAPGGGGGIPPVEFYSCQEALSLYQLRADSALQLLGKNQVSSGILYDRTAGTAYLDLFN